MRKISGVSNFYLMKDLISVRIDSSDKLIWEGQAKSVSSINTTGPFDILPFHSNFITLVEDEDIIIRVEKGKPLKFSLGRTLIYNHNNTVSIYTL